MTLAWAALGGSMQLGATAALLTAMQRSSFALGTAFQQSGLPFAALLGLLVFHDHLSLHGWGGVLLASALVRLPETWPWLAERVPESELQTLCHGDFQ